MENGVVDIMASLDNIHVSIVGLGTDVMGEMNRALRM
jgi:hypothetical protein